MKIFVATIEAWNRSYVETLLIVAENSKRAQQLVLERHQRDSHTDELVYKRRMTEVKISTEEKQEKVIQVWWGRSENRGEYYGAGEL